MPQSFTPDKKMLKPLPCPFCGGESKIEESSSVEGCNVWCTACHSRSPWFDGYYLEIGEDKKNAIKAWNTRARDAHIEELEAALKIAGEALEAHHKHHQQALEVYLEQDGKPLDFSIDLGEAYSDSGLCEKTGEAIRLIQKTLSRDLPK